MRTCKSEYGFTLIEVLIVMVVLSVGIFSLYSMQIQSMKGNSKSMAISTGANTIRDTVEQMLGKSFTDADFDTAGNPHQITTGLPATINLMTWDITDWSSDGEDNDSDSRVDEFDERGVKSIQLKVQYTDQGVSRDIMIHYLKTELM